MSTYGGAGLRHRSLACVLHGTPGGRAYQSLSGLPYVLISGNLT